MNSAIRILVSDPHGAIVRHLTSLSVEDRFQRFGAALDDAALARYAAALDFGRDRLFCVFDENERLAGLVHVRLDWRRETAWAGVSVSPGSRCQGYGYALLCVAVLDARRAGRTRLALPGLAENRIMLHLARKAGLSVIDEFGKPGAYVALGEPAARAPAPQRSTTARRLRAVMVGMLLPIFGLDMAVMLAAGAACSTCKPPLVAAARR
jgi:GNAT superfamily N-acetyltransferase